LAKSESLEKLTYLFFYNDKIYQALMVLAKSVIIFFVIYFILNVNAFKLALAVENKMSISVSDCEKILAKRKRIKADYVDGIDVRGKPVIGADLSTSNSILDLNEVKFDLSIDIAKRYGLSNEHLDAKARLVRIVFKGGNLFINGYLASSGDQDKLYQNCKRILKPN
tara:strand:+ start:344 stop:844 length:501 start_codon:yes stop_codon:yes gene_type:complete